MSKTTLAAITILVIAFIVITVSFLKNRNIIPEQEALESTYTSQENNKANSQRVSLPSERDTITTFFTLIDEGKVVEAVSMLAPRSVANESQKQAWGVQFNAFESVKVLSITPAGENLFKVELDVVMKPESANEVIPYYGFNEGENTRWVELEKVDNRWKVTGIATGP